MVRANNQEDSAFKNLSIPLSAQEQVLKILDYALHIENA